MSEHSSGSRLQTVSPADPRFAFRVAVPADWAQLTPPAESLDLAHGEEFQPVAVLAARYGAVVVTLSVRPAPAGGSVAEWLGRLAAADGIELTEIGPASVGDLQGVGAVGEQQSQMGPMTMRVVMFEQGGFAHSLLGMAPTALWGALGPTFDEVFASFAMVEALPQTVAAWPDDEDAGGLDAGSLKAEDLAAAKQTAAQFLAAVQRGDDAAAKALLRDEDQDSVTFPFSGEDGASFELGEAAADGERAVVEARLRSPAAAQEQEMPLVLQQDGGAWRVDMTASINRMLGVDVEECLTDMAKGIGQAATDALDSVMQGLAGLTPEDEPPAA